VAEEFLKKPLQRLPKSLKIMESGLREKQLNIQSTRTGKQLLQQTLTLQ